MVEPLFQIRQCLRDSCGFRFPLHAVNETDAAQTVDIRCPRCGAITQAVEMVDQSPHAPWEDSLTNRPAIDVVLDNIRSTYNVGAMFRTADGAGLRHLYLCGMTPTPDNPKIGKTSLGAEASIPWSYSPDAFSTARNLKQNGSRLWALESCPTSISIFEVIAQLEKPAPVALVVGNEVSGVDPGILAECDQIIAIPMQGVKRSLNVAIAFGIAVYFLRYGMYLNLGNKTGIH